MAAFVLDKNRKVIPRWRQSTLTVGLHELDSLLPRASRRILDPTTLEEKVRDWQANNTVAFAAEVAAAALVLGVPERARDAARFILSSECSPTAALRHLAQHVLSPTDPSEEDRGQPSVRIRLLRAIVREDPRNAIRWVDLAREYAILGLLEKSKFAMKVGINLAPDNRFVVRSAARLFVHTGDPAFAHYLLFRTGSAETDPWIMAAEIAVASVAGRQSNLVKPGRKLLNSGSFAPFHVSELAGALATLELESGNRRLARKLFRQALADPTANAVAQARWAQKDAALEIGESALSVSRAHEARAWSHHYAGRWEPALYEAKQWFEDEPYSSRPPALGSYIASTIFQDYEEGIRIARQGLTANADEPTLLNNLAFALICSKQLPEAEAVLHRLNRLPVQDRGTIVRLATSGLLCYRRGDPDAGRALYLRAIQGARNAGSGLLRARAAANFALEEQRIKSPRADEAKALAIEAAKDIPDLDLRLLLYRVDSNTSPGG